MPDIREEFERAYGETENVYYVPGLDVYGCETSEHREQAELKSAAWYWWQKSRAALLKDHVPMPRQCPSWLEDAYDEAWQDDKHFIDGLSLPAYEAMLKAQEEALQQAGIGVKHG